MLTPFDDYPIHQTPEPLAHPGSGDRNAYDRYFFNGYDRDGGFFFAAAMGCYPNRQVIDAAFSIVRDGRQRSVFASGRVPLDRTKTTIGPITVDVVEPMRTLRLSVTAANAGVEADVTFRARTVAVEEPRFRMLSGSQLVSDYTRLAQWGTWEGTLRVDGAEVPVDPAAVLGCRDRSWGVRPVGEPAGGAPSQQMPQYFWLWAPLNFDDHCTHLALNDDGEGNRWYESSARIDLLESQSAPTFGVSGAVEHMRSAEVDIEWEPGTRRARRATLTLAPWRAEPAVITLEPLLTFQMKGIGYFHPEWAHGVWRGETAEGSDSWILDEIDPLGLPNIHVQQLCRATVDGRRGVGVLEQLAIGPHPPTGLTGLLDGAS